MNKYMGNYLSTVKNPQLKVSRILQIAQDLKITLEEIENMDAVKQEDFERQLELSSKQLLNTVKTLDEEVALNNELIKENHLLDVRVKHMSVVSEHNDEQIKTLMGKVLNLKKYKQSKRAKFEKWLKKRLKKKKHSIKGLVVKEKISKPPIFLGRK